MIAVRVNHDTILLEEGSSVADLVARLDSPPAALSTAVNGEFVARAARSQRVLRDGDQVTTFQPITGG